MTTKVKAVSVQIVELFKEDGTPLGFFSVTDEWQGLHRLVPVALAPAVSDELPCLIVDHGPDVDSKVFGPRYGEYRAVLDVVKASPELASALLWKS